MKKSLIFTSVALSIAVFVAISSCKKRCSKPNEGCVCPAIYAPVCGSDNKTYGSGCEAKCAGITQWTEGECKF